MSLLSELRLLILIFLSKDVRGVITNPPLNAVAEVGQRAIFNCTSDITAQNWVLSAKKEDVGTAAAEVIVAGCVVEPGFTTHYEVDRPGGNTNCNLIVKDTTMQQAGIYTCTDIAPGPSAILTVTDKLLNATYNTTAGVVVEKDNVIIECVLNYNGTLSPAPTLRPYFYWTNSTHNVSSSYDSTSDTTAVSQLTVTAGRQDITPFTCHVYFQLIPPTNTGYASNTPAVSNSATSLIITVLPVPPSTTQSESTATVSTTGSTTACTSGDSCDVAIAAAIAVGVILFISLALNIMQLIIMVKNIRTKHDPFKRAGTNRTILSPETLDLSNEPPAPATYEELTRSNEIHLQPAYDKLTPKPPAPATYQELTHPDEIHLQPPTYEKLTTKPSSYVDDLS